MPQLEQPLPTAIEFAPQDTIGGAVAATQRALQASGLADPPREARRLVALALSVPAIEIISARERPIGADGATRLSAMLARRVDREPLSRIAGFREFYGLPFEISPATLDPRPDTETLVEAALEVLAAEGLDERPVSILEIGTGTGCVAIALLKSLPQAQAVATDVSQEALEVAARNAQRHGVSDRFEIARTRSLDSIAGHFDLLVSNPPYIPDGDIAALDPEVRRFDPRAALAGGADGLDIYREIAAGLDRVVANGWAVFEVGAGQAADVARLFDGGKTRRLRMWQDLHGHTRCVAVRTQSTNRP
ncbi:MAG: peptide chain release factor N(5)-glutamine methyltransferase [Hyphomicrobiaceae bacterium]|nr:peptide chain release factor N(5)-glutamine methyltransferase [Hyphomicrobiaceae bacterium]